MSLDTSLVVARVGNNFVPVVVQAVENLFDGPAADRWRKAQVFLDPNRQSFVSPAAAIEHGREHGPIEYAEPIFAVVDLERKMIRRLD